MPVMGAHKASAQARVKLRDQGRSYEKLKVQDYSCGWVGAVSTANGPRAIPPTDEHRAALIRDQGRSHEKLKVQDYKLRLTRGSGLDREKTPPTIIFQRAPCS
ncbi:hypothetical protein V8Z77_20990, partial [Stutzerimonas stutzeri]|uniref:hypothetical protein n=1 Tax=Stutzerimonas stutzeri TaxID=316 RepID=UPI0031DDDC7C